MATDAAILHPEKTLMVRRGSESIEVTVSELAWPDAIAFLGKLGSHLGKLINEKGEVRVDLGLITELIAGSTELANELIAKSTDEDADMLKDMRASDALAILDAALELNLSDELIERGKTIAGRFKKFATMRTANPAT
jgi:hypothetical protein